MLSRRALATTLLVTASLACGSEPEGPVGAPGGRNGIELLHRTPRVQFVTTESAAQVTLSLEARRAAGDGTVLVDATSPLGQEDALAGAGLGGQLQPRHAVEVHLERHRVARDEFPGVRREAALEAYDVVWRERDVDALAARVEASDAGMAPKPEAAREPELHRLDGARGRCFGAARGGGHSIETGSDPWLRVSP